MQTDPPVTDQHEVQTSAAVVLGSAPEPRDTAKHGKRLTQGQIAMILQLANANQTQLEIAQRVGCHPATVARTLDQFVDGRELARKRLENGALKLAATVVNTKDSAVALKALGKLDVVREDQASAGTNVLIAIGQPGQNAPDAVLSPPTITALALSPAPQMAVTVEQPEAKATPSEGVSPSKVA